MQTLPFRGSASALAHASDRRASPLNPRRRLTRAPHRPGLAALIAVAIAACGEPVQPPAVMETVPALFRAAPVDDDAVIPVAHVVLPRETSESGEIDWVPSANSATALHYVWLPARDIKHARLLVFMPGTGNQPVNYRLFSAEAARAGFHVIGLMYQNDKGVDALCKASTDTDCAENARMESLTGDTTLSGLLTITPGNSIDHRLERLLVHLSTNFPEEGWDEFLKHGKPDWSKIAVSGQSQGAGQAALIARERRVARVVMLSGPPDQSNAPAIDSWVRIGRTPASRMFALYHYNDAFEPGISANMGERGFGLEELGTVAVGTAGPWCSRADSRPLTDNFGDAHLLVTNLLPRGTLGCVAPNPHRSTARDEFTPLAADGKTPALLGAWRHIIGDPAEKFRDRGDDDDESL